jgi:hypothetical protein
MPDLTDFVISKETKTRDDGTTYEIPVHDWNAFHAAELAEIAEEKAAHRGKIERAFEERGITSAEVEFSGGNDSGGADNYNFFDAAGNAVDITMKYNSTNRNVDGRWITVELTDVELSTNDFISLVEMPIQWKWGSFAGDFNVYGNLYYDITAENHCRMSYEESTYEHHEESF